MGELRAFFAFLFSGILIFGIYMLKDNEVITLSEKAEVIKNRPLIPPCYLMIIMGVLVALCLLDPDMRVSLSYLASIFFSVFLHTSLYFCLLLLLLPLLRRYISAWVCGALWLLPNFLYVTVQSFMMPDSPLFVIKLSSRVFRIVTAVWLTGFLAVMLWKTAGHLTFRRYLLKGSRRIEYRLRDDGVMENADILNLWQNLQHEAGIKKRYYPLIISPHAVTPLSIGLFRRNVRVILPDKRYEPVDLELILHHELVHICREDCWTKLFLVFCTAMCWFNPLMWVAMRRCADDLELSCDETVLSEAGDEVRGRYAKLILSSAGDGRGFTTCLSASASAMRYRLKSIVSPGKRFTGAITAGILFFVLLMTCGSGTLAIDDGTVGDYIGNGAVSPSGLNTISVGTGYSRLSYECIDPEALTEYLSGLKKYKFGQNYGFYKDEKSLIVFYDINGVNTGICLRDHSVSATPLHGNANRGQKWYIDGGVDWDYIMSLLTPCKSVSFVYEPPELLMAFDNMPDGELMYAQSRVLSVLCDGEEIEKRQDDALSPGGAYGSPAKTVTLVFSHEPREYTVTEENWNRTEKHTVEGASLEDNTIVLPSHSVHYTLHAVFDTVPEEAENVCTVTYEMEYAFDFRPMGYETEEQ